MRTETAHRFDRSKASQGVVMTAPFARRVWGVLCVVVAWAGGRVSESESRGTRGLAVGSNEHASKQQVVQRWRSGPAGGKRPGNERVLACVLVGGEKRIGAVKRKKAFRKKNQNVLPKKTSPLGPF